MNETKYDLLVFIGRFQPFHVGHRRVVQLALQRAHNVLILVGSSFKARDSKNPFTYDERRDMITCSMNPEEISRVSIMPLRDHLYNDNKWIAEVQQHVNLRVEYLRSSSFGSVIKNQPKIGVIGYEKDESSWYLKAFPQWNYEDVGRDYNETIDATEIRKLWLTGQSANYTSGVLHRYVHEFLYDKFPKKEFDRLAREYTVIADGKKMYAGLKYPVQFLTCDAVVVQSGHVLLVQRKAAPGEGLWAVPGGYLNPNESFEQGMLRELREETKIKVPEPVLRGNIKGSHIFDAPSRSLRGRIVTRAFLIELPPGELPKIKGSDDAAKAKWVPLAEFEKMEDQMFEDHHHIVSYFLGRV